MFYKVFAVVLALGVSLGTLAAWQPLQVEAAEGSGTIVDSPNLNLLQATSPNPGDTIVTLHTTLGDITLRLFPEEAPMAYANFVIHAREGYYDGLTFHRVIEDFMIQGGDPEGTGEGGQSVWDQGFGTEFSRNLHHFTGALAMARTSFPDSIGSQFYIVQGSTIDEFMLAEFELLLNYQDEILGIDWDGNNVYVRDIFSTDTIHAYMRYGGTPHLDLAVSETGSTVFGQVIAGMDVVNAIAALEVDDRDKPVTDVIIQRVTVEIYGAPLHYDLPAPIAGDVVWASFGQAWTLDPHMFTDANARDIMAQVYEGLMWHTPDNTLEPLLAESFTVSEDQLTYTFHLRQGVTFHDGMPFSATAVKTSFERMWGSDARMSMDVLYEILDEIIIVDNYTIQFVLSSPHAAFLTHLTHPACFIISPTAILEDAQGGRILEEHPVGTGPFMFDYLVWGDYTRLTPNPNHWRSTPAHDVIFQVIPSHLTPLTMIDQGAADVIRGFAADAHQLDGMPHVEWWSVPSAVINYIGFNTAQDGPLSDARVRRAMSMAINRAEILEIVQDNQGILPTNLLRDGVVAHAPTDMPELPFDPDAARELLAEAGFPDGFHTTIWTNEGNMVRFHTAELVQMQLAAIDIYVDIVVVDWGTYLDLTSAGEHDMFLLGWGPLTGDADSIISPLLHSDEIWFNNRTHYANSVVDELLERARTALDPEYRDALYREISEIVSYDTPMVLLFHPDIPVATRGIDGMQFNWQATPYFFDVTIRPRMGIATAAQRQVAWQAMDGTSVSVPSSNFLSVMSLVYPSDRIIATAFEELNITLDIFTIPIQNATEIITIMAAAGDMADLSFSFDGDLVQNLAEWGVLRDMRPYLEGLAHELPYLMDFIGDAIWENVHPETGGIYSIIINDPAYTSTELHFFVSEWSRDLQHVMVNALRYLDLLSRPENRQYFAMGAE